MNKATKELSTWQKDFEAAPQIYYTTYKGEVLNFYSSLEAAKLEVAYCKRLKEKPAKIHAARIHDLGLSKRRWSE